MVTVEEMRQNLERRSAARQSEELRMAEAARGVLSRLVAKLTALGATSVTLFGSLADRRFRADSDIDLATTGLGFRESLKAQVLCTELAGRQVDVVRLEDAPPQLAARIRESGERLS